MNVQTILGMAANVLLIASALFLVLAVIRVGRAADEVRELRRELTRRVGVILTTGEATRCSVLLMREQLKRIEAEAQGEMNATVSVSLDPRVHEKLDRLLDASERKVLF